MPTLDISDFDESPKIGDKVKVMGKVESIDRDTGEVDVTYDKVTIVDKSKKKHRNNDDEDDGYDSERVVMREEVVPQSQSLDQALAQSFPNTQ